MREVRGAKSTVLPVPPIPARVRADVLPLRLAALLERSTRALLAAAAEHLLEDVAELGVAAVGEESEEGEEGEEDGEGESELHLWKGGEGREREVGKGPRSIPGIKM